MVAAPQPASAATHSFGDSDVVGGNPETATFTCASGFDGMFAWGGDELDGFRLQCDGVELDDFGATAPDVVGSSGRNCATYDTGNIIGGVRVFHGNRIDSLEITCTNSSWYQGAGGFGGTSVTVCVDQLLTEVVATSAVYHSNNGRRVFGLELTCN